MPQTQDTTYPAPASATTGAVGLDATDFASRLFGATGTNVNPFLTGAGVSNEPQVLWGYVSVPDRPGPVRGPGTEELGLPPGTVSKRKQQQWITLDRAAADIYGWSEAKLKSLGDKLVASGRLDPDYTRAELVAAWQELVTKAAATAKTPTPMTPWDMLGWLGGDGTQGGGPRTQVNRQVQIASPDQARAILRSSLSAFVGRPASETEVDDFQAMLNAAFRANPTVTRTTYSASGDTSTTTTSGGVAPDEVAREFAEQELGDEWGNYTAVAQFFPALEQAIQSPF